MKYHGYTHYIPLFLLPLWAKILCRFNWHIWDEVKTIDEHFFVCDACEIEIALK
jgi:hypothetical protein